MMNQAQGKEKLLRVGALLLTIGCSLVANAAHAQGLNDIIKEVKAAKGQPAVIQVERVSEPGVYDNVVLFYGFYGDANVGAAHEIATYAQRKYKRRYQVILPTK
jgi:hypothetical protein